jgi:hypothetical protein
LTLSGAFVGLNPGATYNFTTSANGLANFTIFADESSSATASLVGYSTATGSFVCTKNGTQYVPLYLTPLVNTLTIEVRDNITREVITTATVALSGPLSSTRNVSSAGQVVYNGLKNGTYSALASATGYYSNSSGPISLGFNQTVFVVIYLAPAPCLITLTVYDNSTGQPLNQAVVTWAGYTTTNTTGANGIATFSTVFYNTSSSVSATKVGYTTGTANFQCTRNGTSSLTIYLSPVLNTLTIEVRDQRTEALITSATVALSGTQTATQQVNAAARALFPNIPGGSYVATATAPGYYPNSTGTIQLTYNQTEFRLIYLLEIPCTVIVTVIDNSTNAALTGALVALDNSTIPSQTTSGNGTVMYILYSNQANTVFGSKTGYTGASSPLNCASNKTVPITLILSPVPNTIIVTVLDGRTLKLITTATVFLTGQLTRTQAVSNATASTTFYPVPMGTYQARASASGYRDNSTGDFSVSYNSTSNQTIYLYELPCTVTVITRDNSTGALLSGVFLSLNSTTANSNTTGSSGTVSFSILYDAASSVSGSKTGYLPASAPFLCSQNGNVTVTLYLIPVFSNITIQVRDAYDFSLVEDASVTLTGPFTETRNAEAIINATTTFFQVPGGNYSTSATSPTHYPNSTVIGTVGYNQSVFFIIYLTPLPCNVVVTVLLQGQLTPIEGANITFESPSLKPLVTNAQGQVTFSQVWDINSNVSAGKTNYTSGWDEYFCLPGSNESVTLLLNRVFLITIGARDVFTSGQPFIQNPTLLLNTTEIRTVSAQNPAWRTTTVFTFPVTYVIQAISKGYQQSNATVRFSENRTSYFISLAPVDFTLYFGLEELYTNGSKQWISNAIASGYQARPGERYEPQFAYIGGQAVQSNTSKGISFTDRAVFNTTMFTSVFDKLTPTSDSKFFLNTRTQMSLITPNYNNSVGDAILVFIPDFNVTEERTLLYLLPYRINVGFILGRVTPYAADKVNKRAFEGGFVTMFIYQNDQSSAGYQSLFDLTSQAVVFEFNVVFGTFVLKMNSTFPTEVFDKDASNWVNPSTGNVITGDASQIFSFQFPGQKFLDDTFVDQPNGQKARRPNTNLYILFDYKLFYLPGVKRQAL